MYICICNAVTDHDIADAVRSGLRSMRELENTLMVSTGCGKCRGDALDFLERQLALLATNQQDDRIAKLP